MKKILFVANLDNGIGMSGGTTIYLELLKRFPSDFRIQLMGSSGTIKLLENKKIPNIEYYQSDTNDSANLFSIQGLIIHTLRRLIGGINTINENFNRLTDNDYIFSVSDFWPDILPALYLKWKAPHSKWVAAFYFFAPKPWQKDNPYAVSLARRVVGVTYWASQQLAYQCIKRWSNLVIACNEIDRKIFIKDGYPADQIIAIYGGVDLPQIQRVPGPATKKYDAIFMARFHPQKAPMVAVKAWNEVIKSLPKAKLAMIGNGPEESKVTRFIKDNHLEENVDLLGFMEGSEKYKKLKSSRIFIHPAIYETGGMAAAEGMACELPVIAFDQEGFHYCYPHGMVKISPIGDHKKFAQAIIDLLGNKNKYATIRKQAIALIEKEWDWNKRSAYVVAKLNAISAQKNNAEP